MLIVNFTLTKEDYCSFYLHVMWDEPSKRRKRRMHYLKQSVTTVLFTGVFYYSGLFYRSNSFSYIVLAFLLLTSILSVTGLRNSLLRQAEKISEDADNNSFFLHTQVTINDTGILLKDAISERSFKWVAFIKMEENKAYYFLFYNASEALIFPKKLFKTLQDKNLFDELLSKYLSFDAAFKNQIKI